MNFRSVRTLLHALALAMTLVLAVAHGHWFWWVFTGFNLWVGISYLVWLAWGGKNETDAAERPSPSRRRDWTRT